MNRTDEIPEPILRRAVNASCTCGGCGPHPGICPACMVWHRVQAAVRDVYDHRSDPRTMTARWAAMGFQVEWEDGTRCYVVRRLDKKGGLSFNARLIRTVNEVEAYVTAHASGEVGT